MLKQPVEPPLSVTQTHLSSSESLAQQPPFQPEHLAREAAGIVKINGPSTDGILPRRRLFSLLDNSSSGSVIWITAPAGSGKTALAASYLDERHAPFLWYQCDCGERDIATFFYYLGLAAKQAGSTEHGSLPLLTAEYRYDIRTFSRNFFQKLCLFLKPGSFIVFDNFQEVASDSLLMELLVAAAEYLPDGIRFIFISRTYPPQSFARMQLNKQLLQVDGDDLDLTFDEVKAFISHYVEDDIAPEVIDSIYTGSHGWIAAVILLIHQKGEKELFEGDVDFTSNEILFDYFAGELFQAEEPEVKRFLVFTSFFPEFSEEMAREISGHALTADVLHRLLRRNFFITRHRHGTYQYHPLFQEFLQSRATRVLGADETEGCIQKSAELLDGNGKAEDAAILFIQIKNYPSLIPLICREAVSFIQRGQAQTLLGWIEQIPEPLRESHPWLLYWGGMCELPFNLVRAKILFEKAYATFRREGDIPGIFSAWSGVVEATLHHLENLSALDHWIVIFDELWEQYGDNLPSGLKNQTTAAMFMSLVLRGPDHLQFSCWKEKALIVLARDANISRRIFTGFFLLSHSYWVGDLGMADKIQKEIRLMADSPDALPLARIVGYFSVSWHGCMSGDYSSALRAANCGLDLAKESGVVIWNSMIISLGAVNHLSEGDPGGADPWLDRLATNLSRARTFDLFYYHHVRAWQALLRNRPQEALACQQVALDNAERCGAKPVIGLAHFAMSQICHDLGTFAQRDHHLAECRLNAEQCRSRIHLFMVGLAEAQYTLDAGHNEHAAALLRQVMAVGRVEGYYNFSFWRSSMVTPLVVFCLEKGIETDYVTNLIRKRHLTPEQPPVKLENWPWPLRIYTLGRFSVLQNGTPLLFGRKAPVKVLELLKALIALGGSDVSEDRLSDLLWPDSEGDAARQALKTTLFRLRKWLGGKDAIIRSEGLISLAPHWCWIDVRAVELLLEQADHHRGNAGELIKKATALYAGDFLAEDRDKPWATLLRERLRGKMLHAIRVEAEQSSRAGQFRAGISYYQQGIGLDPLAEELYRGLMDNYMSLGETAHALATYEQLKSILKSTYDVAPSLSTQELFRRLMSQ